MISDNIRAFIETGFEAAEKKRAFRRAEELISRGLTDEKIIIDILSSEKKIPKRLTAELYDKVNYMCRRWMDRIMRFEIDYDFLPDIDALKTAIICLVESAPVLHSRFIDNHINPYWQVSDYHIDDIFSVQESDILQESADEFLTQTIPVKNNVQIKIGLFCHKGKSSLCFAVNHMCMDGGGLKCFLNDLFKAYNSYIEQGKISVFHSDKSRAYERVYDDMSEEDGRTAKKLFANISNKDKHSLSFSPVEKNDKNIIVRKKIGKDIFEAARLKAKKYGATANDLIVAAYIRAFYDIAGCNETEGVSIGCAVDLRKHIKNPEKIGYTNLLAFVPCGVDTKGKTMTDTLKSVKQSMDEIKSDRFMGLHGQPLLKLGFSTMVYVQAEFITSLFYNNSNLSVSNIGAINPASLSLGSTSPSCVWFGGGAKEKPCAAVNLLSYNGDLMITACFRGNESDEKLLLHFLDKTEENIGEFLADLL